MGKVGWIGSCVCSVEFGEVPERSLHAEFMQVGKLHGRMILIPWNWWERLGMHMRVIEVHHTEIVAVIEIFYDPTDPFILHDEGPGCTFS